MSQILRLCQTQPAIKVSSYDYIINTNKIIIIIIVVTADELKEDTLPIVIIVFGSILGTLCIMIVLITTVFMITLVVVIRSNRALRKQLNVLKGKLNQQPAIYEEIPQRRESVKSSTPSIETGENTAYATVFLSSVSCNKTCK